MNVMNLNLDKSKVFHIQNEIEVSDTYTKLTLPT